MVTPFQCYIQLNLVGFNTVSALISVRIIGYFNLNIWSTLYVSVPAVRYKLYDMTE